MPDEPIRARRLAFALFAALVALSLATLCWRVLAPGGWTVWEELILLCYLATLPWIALCAANALVGFALLLGTPDPPAAVLPALRAARDGPSNDPPCLRTAIAVCIRNEPMDAVLPPLAALLDGLAVAGVGARFEAWILSDTQDPALAEAEAAAIAGFAAALPLRYRRRASNAGFKAGNVMEFLDGEGAGHDLLLVLDADSAMSAAAVLRLVACMEADPRLAILQPLIAGRPATAAFPRLFQFGMRAGMRAWATGQAWWQGDEGPYWGHNALIRIAPFRAHCRLPVLPDGRPILSHDQVEAVLLHAAGWKVRCLPDDTGSLEANPPALPEFMRRDGRWAAGNMQYVTLLRRPALLRQGGAGSGPGGGTAAGALTPMGRWQLLQAILLFLTAPLWPAMLALAVLNVVSGGAAATPRGALLALLLASWLALHAPKLLGYAELLLRPDRARRFGGRLAVLRGAAAELLFTLLLDPPSLFGKTLALLGLLLGRGGGWAPQNRADRGVAWADAARLLWPQTAFGVASLGLLLAHSPAAALWSLPFTAGLALAIPLCVLTAHPGFSAWLRRHRIAATPEELAAAS
ncbi:glucans biosynthesis glucosyltransferase MdoH [Roseomonas sp. NAR14]|uniref:Glucans biosynthesis glucosyltransferase H n=1 Tax=Roseomonas acroporae TaxID=2937791 RepID=A0A9X1YB81_9PROT|nr:glucans biosynthesis glucosyltransferase MdoH [Roseomonas acroporae]